MYKLHPPSLLHRSSFVLSKCKQTLQQDLRLLTLAVNIEVRSRSFTTSSLFLRQNKFCPRQPVLSNNVYSSNLHFAAETRQIHSSVSDFKNEFIESLHQCQLRERQILSFKKSVCNSFGSVFLQKRTVQTEVQQKDCQMVANNNLNIDWELKEVVVQCIQGLWEENLNGVEVLVKYIDTHGNLSKSAQKSSKIILGLLGFPGSYEDFLPLLQPFVQEGYRVIIPLMPGFGDSKIVYPYDEQFFAHNTSEKTDVVIQLMRHLRIKRLHHVIAHDLGTGILTVLLGTTSFIDSAIYLCPIPGHKPPKLYQPFNRLVWLIHKYDNGSRLFRPIARKLMASFWKNKDIDVPSSCVVPFSQSVVNYGYDSLAGLGVTYTKKPFNISLMYSAQDNIVDKQQTLDYAQLLQFNIADVFTTSSYTDHEFYKPKKSEGESGSHTSSIDLNEGYRRVLEFDCNDHFPHQSETFRTIIRKEMKLLMEQS